MKTKLKLFLLSELLPATILCSTVFCIIWLFDKYVAPHWWYAKIF